MVYDPTVEEWRLIVIPSRLGWRTFVVWDDGVELVEDVDLSD